MTAAPTDATMKVEIYTDGACLGNPGPGGWACIVRCDMETRELSGGAEHTTNNRMELTAVIEGLRTLDHPSQVLLCSDSEYVLKGLSEWMAGWKKRGWRTSQKKPVLNVELWKTLDELASRHQMKYEWVRGHTGHAENERCDQLAMAEAMNHKAAL
jgi:ribonuclease HI